MAAMLLQCPSHRAGCHRRRHRGCPPCRLPGGELPEHRQGDDPDRQEVQVQAGELILVGEPMTHAERQRATDNCAGEENDRVLNQKVRDDVAFAGADGTQGTDLFVRVLTLKVVRPKIPRQVTQRMSAVTSVRKMTTLRSAASRRCR